MSKPRGERTGTLKLYTQARHPEHQHRMGRGRGRARRATDLTPLQWKQILDAFDNHCAYCGVKSERLEVEHLIPVDSGGEHSAWNVIPACRSCNGSRKKLPLDEWLNILRRQGGSVPLLERPVGQAKLAALDDSRKGKDNV